MGDVKLTIVGPEPSGPENVRPHKRVNVEALLLMAKYDDDFRRWLFSNREKALSGCGIDFTPGERLLLANISDEQLAANIDEFRVSGITKKSLPNWAKAAAIIILLSSLAFSYVEEGFSETAGIVVNSNPQKRGKVCTDCHVYSAGHFADNDFTQIKKITYPMMMTIRLIRYDLRSGSAEEVLEEYNHYMNESVKSGRKTGLYGSENLPLIKEIETKVKSGMDIHLVLDKYEEIFDNDKTKFTALKDATYQMREVISVMRKDLKSKSIEEVIKEYKSMMTKDAKKPESDRIIRPKIIQLINEIESKVNSGDNIKVILHEYSRIFYIFSPGEPAGISPDMMSPFRRIRLMQAERWKKQKNNRGK